MEHDNPQTGKGFLTPEKRNAYLKALNELVGSLSTLKWTRLDVYDFCKRHELKSSFIVALRDLGCLELNLLAQQPIWYKSTNELIKIAPEDILRKMRANGPKKDNSNNIPPIMPMLIDETNPNELTKLPEMVSETIDNPLTIAPPFLVKIDSEQIQLSYRITTKSDVQTFCKILTLIAG